MLENYITHNRFREDFNSFKNQDPHLHSLSKLRYKYSADWWKELSYSPGIYILTGGRQIGKSTSCKLFIAHSLEKRIIKAQSIFYLPCDEIFDAKELSRVIRTFLEKLESFFILIIDEVTFVHDWDRVIKALADEGKFNNGMCILTGSDTLILKEAAMRFPGRRGDAEKTDFHMYPLTFKEYVTLINPSEKEHGNDMLSTYLNNYLQCGGYLRAINDYAKEEKVMEATFQTYEQWIRGDFLKRNKKEEYLLSLLRALFEVGVSQISYSSLTHKIGLLSKETVIDYCHLLERMDILTNLQAFDQNKKAGFPRKDRKFHFLDPFIYRTIISLLKTESYIDGMINESVMVESLVASHLRHLGRVFYFKGQGEIDVILLKDGKVNAIEVKWSKTLRHNDLKMLRHFESSMILTKSQNEGRVENIKCIPLCQFLYRLNDLHF